MSRVPRHGVVAAVLAASLAVALPADAHSSIVQIANSGAVEPPSCPATPCAVISRTTAVQVSDGTGSTPFVIGHKGRIKGWSVTLALPSVAQIHYFDEHEGGTARAALAVLRPVGALRFELIAESPFVHLEPDFGTTARITLRETIPVIKGDVVALAVPTWLPALALNYPSAAAWRASRAGSRCTDVEHQTVQRVVGSKAAYDCLYQTALVTYAATEVVGH